MFAFPSLYLSYEIRGGVIRKRLTWQKRMRKRKNGGVVGAPSRHDGVHREYGPTLRSGLPGHKSKAPAHRWRRRVDNRRQALSDFVHPLVSLGLCARTEGESRYDLGARVRGDPQPTRPLRSVRAFKRGPDQPNTRRSRGTPSRHLAVDYLWSSALRSATHKNEAVGHHGGVWPTASFNLGVCQLHNSANSSGWG